MKLCNNCKRLFSSKIDVCIYCGSQDLKELPPFYHLIPAEWDEITLNNVLYHIVGVIGRGGFGYVLKIVNPKTNEFFALKLPLSAHLLVEPGIILTDSKLMESEKMLQKEINILQRQSHLGIIGIIESGTFVLGKGKKKKEIPYYIMELAEGDVETLMHTYPDISLQERIKIIREVASALSYLHRKMIVYRDMSQKNILIMDRGAQGVHYVLSDFGTYKQVFSQGTTQKTGLVGTERYIDPAYWTNMEKYHRDPRIDVYSLGIVATELWIGTPNWKEFMGIQGNALAVNFAEDIIKELITEGKIPESIGKVLQKATDRNPDNRYGDANEFLDAFKRALRESNISATVTPLVIETNKSVSIANEKLNDNLPSSKTSKEELTIPFAVKINLPLKFDDATMMIKPIRYEKGKKILFPTMEGTQIIFTEAAKIETGKIIDGPSFYKVETPGKNILNVRLDKERLKSTLRPLVTLSSDLQGYLDFEGVLEVTIRKELTNG